MSKNKGAHAPRLAPIRSGIDPKVVRRVRSSICAIGIYRGDGRDIDLFRDIDIIGTGFLVRKDVVMTNRHVLEGLAHVPPGSIGTWFMESLVSERKHCLKINWRPRLFRLLDDPSGDLFRGALDVGFLVSLEDPTSEIAIEYPPVTFGPLAAARTGRAVAMCGFLGGTEMLDIARQIPEFNFVNVGPLLYQGHIAAVGPYEQGIDPREYATLFTNVGNGPGFSGSPVFLPETGAIIGIHMGGWPEHALGVSLPIDERRVAGWLRVLDENPDDNIRVKMTWAGDLV